MSETANVTPTVLDTIDSWTQGEREQARAHLMKLFVGAFKLDAGDNWCLPLEGEVPLGTTMALQATPYCDFAPRKLVILEPSSERVEHEEIDTYATETTGKLWWKKERQVRAVSRVIEHKSVVTVSRNIWSVQSLFVGQQLQLPSHGTISGDMFGPDGTLGFSSKLCHGPLSISLVVSHAAKSTLPFRAVVLGRFVGAGGSA